VDPKPSPVDALDCAQTASKRRRATLTPDLHTCSDVYLTSARVFPPLRGMQKAR
jgi:hypothetical protein